IAVAETLNKSRLSIELLLNQNLQPRQLEQYINAVNLSITKDFSEAANFLYKRILQECCTYIVDISSQLPSFTERTFAEVLKREIVPADAALASSHRLLIRGLAGSGKTTLLQWIAVRAATKTFEGQLANWNDCIPFYIRLRHYSQSRLPRPEAFIDFAAPAIA